jgi:GT2 family glycosyltransferase
MKEINLCIPTLRRLDLLINCIKTACSGTLLPTSIHIIDNGDICDALPKFTIPVRVFNPNGNYGVARSFNRFMHNCNDYIIISNDDVTFLKDTIERLVNAAESNPKELMFCPEGPRDWNWSLFLQKKRSLMEIGSYDEFFYPAYWEDSDYRWRMKLKGYEPFIVDSCYYSHVGGATAEAIQKTGEHCDNADKLDAYYKLKWGGDRYAECYRLPFNLISKTDNLEDYNFKRRC